MAYTKLDANIIYSTVWKERPEVVKVWFTLMALADRDGYIGASSEGIARAALVSEEITEAALALFSSPDPKSRTKDWEGRRLIEVDGGWRLLNHAKYRDAQSAEEKREAAAKRQREYMDRKRTKEAAEKAALEAASGPSTGNHSLLTRNDRNDRNDHSDQLRSGSTQSLGGGESHSVSESVGERLRQESEQTNISASPPVDPLLDGMPPFGPAAFKLLFGQWPGQDNPKFNERPADAEAAFFKHITSDNYGPFVYALNAQLLGFANDSSGTRRKDLGTFRTFCEERWTKYKDPAPPPAQAVSGLVSTVADIPLMEV